MTRQDSTSYKLGIMDEEKLRERERIEEKESFWKVPVSENHA